MSNRHEEPKTIIRIRDWLEAKRRPGDGMWALWYRANRMALDRQPHVQHVEGYDEETYTGWVQINVARNVRTLLDTAPKAYMPRDGGASRPTHR